MRKNTLLALLLSGTTVLAVGAGASYAKDKMGGHHMKGEGHHERMHDGKKHHGKYHGKRRGGERAQYRAFWAGQRFAKLDTDDSGDLSAEEFSASSEDKFSNWDADNDGTVTEEEAKEGIRKFMEKRIERMANRMLKRFDADNNGSISQEEYTTHQSQRFASLDADGDGMISPREMMRGGYKMGRHQNHGKMMDDDANDENEDASDDDAPSNAN
jgi:hypothetical protein